MTPQEAQQVTVLLESFSHALQSLVAISGDQARPILERIRGDIDDVLQLADPRTSDRSAVDGSALVMKAERVRKLARELHTNREFELDSAAKSVGASSALHRAPQADDNAAAMGCHDQRPASVRKSDGDTLGPSIYI